MQANTFFFGQSRSQILSLRINQLEKDIRPFVVITVSNERKSDTYISCMLSLKLLTKRISVVFFHTTNCHKVKKA